MIYIYLTFDLDLDMPIDAYETYEQALEAIRAYEAADQDDGEYMPDRYGVREAWLCRDGRYQVI